MKLKKNIIRSFIQGFKEVNNMKIWIVYLNKKDQIRIQRYNINRSNLSNYVNAGRMRFTVAKKSHRANVYYKLKNEEKIKNKAEKQPNENIKFILSLGDYKDMDVDIIIERIMSAEEYQKYKNNEGIFKEMKDAAFGILMDNKQFGFATMLKTYNVEGQEAPTWTDEETHDSQFTRFDIRGIDMLFEATHQRVVPEKYRRNGNQKSLTEDQRKEEQGV